ncbi:MAG: oxygen-independent coproporphyrinogen III oxidase [Planctomycetota bacterium]|jgi:oxygen-independent coproporphyrinogen-3 oxidase
MEALTELLKRYDKPGPRYTSYPTAVEFHEGVDSTRYAEHLDAAAERTGGIGFYLHLPFCEERCLFCGCNVVITKKRGVAGLYLEHLEKEIAMVGERLRRNRPIAQYHWGGGTPTYYTPAEMRTIHTAVAAHFDFEPEAEMAIEVDPRVTTLQHLAVLRELGFNRLSMGVQDFDLRVQEAIGREQPYHMTARLLEQARALGFTSTNLDLIYGLPRQTPEAFSETLRLVSTLRPDRIALYSYAHVPWLKGHQRKLAEEELPAPAVKLGLYTSALDAFREQGYRAIGMDHFALPDDEMALAADAGTLGRNFMGYTVKHATDLVACGVSGIGEIGGAFFQNRRKLIEYERDIEQTGFAVDRGYILTEDDHVRRRVIASLMCSFSADLTGLGFQAEIDSLRPMVDDGLVEIDGERVKVNERGRLFIRNICMVFDAHLARHAGEKNRFSRTV